MKNLALALTLFLTGCVAFERSHPPQTNPSRTAESQGQQLRQLCEAYFEDHLRLFPVEATSIGDHRYDDRLPDEISDRHRTQQRRLCTTYLSRLSNLNRSALGASDRVTYDVFKRDLELKLGELEYDEHLLPVGKMFDGPTRFALLGSGTSIQPFKTVRDYENFLGRVKGFETWVDTAIANMRIGLASGIVQPKIIAEKAIRQVESQLVSDVQKSLFYQPILRLPAEIAEPERNRLAREYTTAIRTRILPAYQRLHAFLRDEYLPRCRESVGLSSLPHGRQWYAFLVKRFTTTDLTPDEIFALGNQEVERIRKEMERLRDREGFQGELSAFAKFLQGRARSYSTKADLVNAYEDLRGQITPRLGKLFGRLPKANYEIRSVEEFREKTSASQYTAAAPDGSRPGVFYVNAARISEAAIPASESLFLHEAVPGHHFQISLAREQTDLPRLRRFASYNAYSEGWGLYAESLGPDLGCYADPWQHLDALAMEMWRARRLVVDVGLHWKSWSREQALKFLLETPTVSETQAVLEVDRYIAWPGQALAYKTGQLKISALRAKAEKSLGAKFDLRQFHDELLRDGALPLDVLETKMNAWIEEKRAQTTN